VLGHARESFPNPGGGVIYSLQHVRTWHSETTGLEELRHWFCPIRPTSATLGALRLRLCLHRGRRWNFNDRRALNLDHSADCSNRQLHWCGLDLQGGLHRKTRFEVCLRRRRQQCTARLHLIDGESNDDGYGGLDADEDGLIQLTWNNIHLYSFLPVHVSKIHSLLPHLDDGNERPTSYCWWGRAMPA